ncbi:GPI mannosyltransferase 4 isoform X2 [Drosophila sechellia]|uniref:Mannosyltransferase n=1 Tax=Drosophila sechellia TaxID=7238 RepID=B4IHF6_DROSE|nr:GPI mannosyltransferase 4 isoform X2 [Drosophila sechellia]EDW49180.1 GM11858 [Drosophila sechellia]
MRLTKLWQNGSPGERHLSTYFCFAAVRLLLVFVPQLGYVHPDEFFQSVEVMTGDHFRLEHTRTWEFNNSLPVRSIVLPFALLRIPWSFYEFVAECMKAWWQLELLGTYAYVVFPRLIYTLISFSNDYCCFRICRLYGLRFEIRLLAMGSSWILLVFGTRTFSNSLEMAMCSWLLCLVSECMLRTNTVVYKKEFLEEKYDKAESISERVRIWKLKNSLPAHNLQHLMAMSTICVAGVFNRPTFLLFGAPMVFFWLLRGMGTRSITFRDFNLRIALFCLCALPALVLFIFCDSLYYQHLTLGELHMMHLSIDNFVFTPWNFIKANLDSAQTASHGVHPCYVHLMVNMPMLFNVLALASLGAFAQLLLRFFRAEYQVLPRFQSIVSLMSGAIFVPLFFLSLINHQEPRFLLPVTFPLILLHAPKLITGFSAKYPFQKDHPLLRLFYDKLLSSKASGPYLLKIWYVSNVALTLFFGFIHQAGVYPLAADISHVIATKPAATHVHLITSHIYSLPLHLINIPSSRVLHFNRQTHQRYHRPRDFYMYEYGGLPLDSLLQKVKLISGSCEVKQSGPSRRRYKLYLAIPASLSADLHEALVHSNASSYLNFELLKVFYPHLSTEAFPRLQGRHPCDVDAPHWAHDDLRGTCAAEQLPAFSFAYLNKQFSSFVHQLGLALYEIDVTRNKPRYVSLAHSGSSPTKGYSLLFVQFLICLALCIAAAQAGFIASPVTTYAAAPAYAASYAAPVAYSAPVATYAAAAPAYSTYAAAAPAYSTYAAAAPAYSTYAAAAPAYTASVYSAPAAYAAPVTTYSAPAIVSPFLKKK